jgi:hypothetical protein
MTRQIVLYLPHRRNNPRNSEGAFVTLSDGRILFVRRVPLGWLYA